MLKNKTNSTLKHEIKKSIITPLLILAVVLSGGGFYYFGSVLKAEAARKSKWQSLLENNNIPESYWSKYKPYISRGEYNRVKKALGGSGSVAGLAKKSKTTKWQKLLEKNGIDRLLWQKYLPKVSRGEYKKVKKALKKLGTVSRSDSLGPNIRIGLFSLDPKANSRDRTVELQAVSGAYTLKDIYGAAITTVSLNGSTGIKIGKDKIFEVREADGVFRDYGKKITAEPSDNNGIIKIENCKNDKYDTDGDGNRFAVGCYNGYNQFRGKIELSLDDNDTPWVINELPIEQYTWGTGEIGDLDYEYYKLFSIVFRTYGYRSIEHKKSTHEYHNFNLSDTSSDQIYKGYKIEERYPDMKKATQETKGKILTYKGKTALTPYCSWSDGRTRDYPGDYPYLKGRKDKYGKHPSKSTKELKDEGNHMYGLIANGARKMINKGKSYKDAINYYYKEVDIKGVY